MPVKEVDRAILDGEDEGFAVVHTLATLAATIHCYPTQVEVLKRIADAYSRTKLTPRVAGLMKKWLAWRR
ncbi:MAG: hypothetical protein IID44_00185 [Planctomycetes bacterium]|nr:hypothetical protein [Planctomycetota bacterium]